MTSIDFHFTTIIRYAHQNPFGSKGAIKWFETDSDKPPLDDAAKKKLVEVIADAKAKKELHGYAAPKVKGQKNKMQATAADPMQQPGFGHD